VQDTFFKLLIPQGVFIALGVLIVITLLHMLYHRRSPTSMIAWLLLMIAIPYFSIVLYYLIGIRKRSDAKKKSSLKLRSTEDRVFELNSIDRILHANGISGTSSGNSIELISDSVDAYETLIEEIRKAERCISLSTYILQDDSVTRSIIDALAESASRGVEIRILVDSLGSHRLYFFPGALTKLRRAGCEVHFFMPILRLPYQNHINLRNHRKIYLFDECRLLTGGMNLSSEYIGPGKDETRCEDILFMIRGAATYQYSQIFEADWAYASGSTLRPAASSSKKIYGDAYIQVVPSGPDIEGDALFETLISAIHTATERIWIVTPYFIPDESLLRALRIAKHKGLDIKLITPKESDHIIADLSRSSYMRELQENGIDLVLYKKGMLHAKAILFDSSSVMIGSVNFDNRSLLLNYEAVSFAYSKSIISEMETWMQGFIKDGETTMPKASKLRRIAENFMRILAPQL